jgi:hypothetical protein
MLFVCYYSVKTSIHHHHYHHRRDNSTASTSIRFQSDLFSIHTCMYSSPEYPSILNSAFLYKNMPHSSTSFHTASTRNMCLHLSTTLHPSLPPSSLPLPLSLSTPLHILLSTLLLPPTPNNPNTPLDLPPPLLSFGLPPSFAPESRKQTRAATHTAAFAVHSLRTCGAVTFVAITAVVIGLVVGAAAAV